MVNRVNDRVTRYFSHDVPIDEFNLIELFHQPTNRIIIIYILWIQWYGNAYKESTFNDFMAFVKIKGNIINVHTQNEFKYYEVGIKNQNFKIYYPNIQVVLQKRLWWLHRYDGWILIY